MQIRRFWKSVPTHPTPMEESVGCVVRRSKDYYKAPGS